VHAPVAATIWKVEVATGQPVSSGQLLVIVESMKMEIRIEAPVDGVVRELCCQPGRGVKSGQVLILLETTA
jgi:urea carboxylase